MECPQCDTETPGNIAQVDFLLDQTKTAVEIKGEVHSKRKQSIKDTKREQRLYSCGYHVISISNEEVKELWDNFKKQRHTSEQNT